MLGPLTVLLLRGARRAAVILSLCALPACGVTTDALGEAPDRQRPSNPPGDGLLEPLTGPSSYPNEFSQLLGKSDAEIHFKIEQTFAKLFFGADDERIYEPVPPDQASIWDTFNGDLRTEGLGYGMMIAVQLDKRPIFDRIWTFTKNARAYPPGHAYEGYFRSMCASLASSTGWAECADPFGHQQIVMALIFAHNRWGMLPDSLDYATDAHALLRVMREKKAATDVAGRTVTPMFDPVRKLVYHLPNDTSRNKTRPSIEMPAYYELWAEATQDPFWKEAAAAAREHWKLAANANTGLVPARSDFDGNPDEEFPLFMPEAYRFYINVVLDFIWFSRDDEWHVSNSNRVLQFFTSQGVDDYGTAYTTDGMVQNPDREPALVLVNGITAGAASMPGRKEFMEEVWNYEIPAGRNVYYQGLMKLLGLLILGGQYRVY